MAATEEVIYQGMDLPYKPREWQDKVHRAKKRFNVLALHRRAGKTELAIMQLIDAAMEFDKEMGLFIYLAPYLKQAKAIAWLRLKEKLDPMIALGQVEVREGDNSVVFKHNGCMIRLFGGDNPDAMRGLRIDGAVIDEVAQIKKEVWDEIVQPAMADRKGWAIFIGTPNGVNLFSELYYHGLEDPLWQSGRWTVYDTDALDPEEIERLKATMTENAFAREFLCDFSAQAENTLISLHQCMDAVNSPLRMEDVEGSPVILGVDVARYGDDRSVIFKRQGLIASKPKVYQELSNMELAAIVAEMINHHHPDMVCIDAGRGEGVIDRLRQLGHSVIEVNFGGKPMNPHYVNKRAEMWDAVKLWLGSGGKIPNDQRLIQDLCTPTYSYDNAAQKFQLESKDKIRERGLPSPDLGDALALTFAYPAEPAPSKSITGANVDLRATARRRKREYDPLDHI